MWLQAYRYTSNPSRSSWLQASKNPCEGLYPKLFFPDVTIGDTWVRTQCQKVGFQEAKPWEGRTKDGMERMNHITYTLSFIACV